jgi:hypothetical protein
VSKRVSVQELNGSQAVAEIPFRLSKPFLINLRLAPGDVKTRPLGFKQLPSLIFRFAKIYCQKRFNDRSKGFPLWTAARLGLSEDLSALTSAWVANLGCGRSTPLHAKPI